jgi:hypothetical protein
VHALALEAVLKDERQGLHARFVVDVGDADTKVPGTHVVHAVHDAALGPVLYPFVHALHARSAVSVPFADTKVPAAHVVQVAHAVTFDTALKVPG